MPPKEPVTTLSTAVTTLGLGGDTSIQSNLDIVTIN